MKSPFKSRPPGIVLTGLKAFLASGALAGAIGIWTLLANQVVEGSNTKDVNTDNDVDDSNSLDPMPTLVSLIQLRTDDQSAAVIPTDLPPAMRTISAIPTATVSIQPQPVQTVNLGAGSGGAQQSGGSAKKPARKKSAAKTRSS